VLCNLCSEEIFIDSGTDGICPTCNLGIGRIQQFAKKFVVLGCLGLFSRDISEAGVRRIVNKVCQHNLVDAHAVFTQGLWMKAKLVRWLEENALGKNVIMIGHSWGGHAVIRTSELWSNLHPGSVKRVVTFDAVHKRWYLYPLPCYEKASSVMHYNFYQRHGWLRGNIIYGAENVFLPRATHQSVDEDKATEVSKSLLYFLDSIRKE